MSSALQKKFIVDLKSGVISVDPTTSDVAIIQREQYAKQLFFTILDPDGALGEPPSTSTDPRITCRLAYKNINKYNPDEYTSNTVDCISGSITYNGVNCFCAHRSLTEDMIQFPGKLFICLQILDADTESDDDLERYFRTLPLNLIVLPSQDLTIAEFNDVDEPEITDGVESALNELLANINITTDKIQNGAVTSEKIADQQIESKHMKQRSVTNYHLSDAAVRTKHIADGSITAAKITSSEAFNEPLTYYIRRISSTTNKFLGFNAKDQSQQSATSENGVITSINELISQYYLKGLPIKAAIGVNDDGSQFFWGDLLWISSDTCVFGGRNHSNYYQLEFSQGENNNLVVTNYAVFSSIFRLRASDGRALGTRSDGVTYHPSIPFSTLFQHYQQNDLIRAFITTGAGAVWGELSWLTANEGVFTAIDNTIEYRLKIKKNTDDSIEVTEYKVTPLPQKWKYSTATLFENNDSYVLDLNTNYIASIYLLIPKANNDLSVYGELANHITTFTSTTDNTILQCQFIPLNDNMWFYRAYMNGSMSTGTFTHTDQIHFIIDQGPSSLTLVPVINTELKLKG